MLVVIFFFKQKTAYEMRISDWSSDVCSSDLNELANVARRKMQMSWTETHAFLSTLRSLLTVRPLTLETHETGLALAQRYGLSTYDAMIAASALHAGCDTLWSEDMQHGLALDERLRIVNPFRAAS